MLNHDYLFWSSNQMIVSNLVVRFICIYFMSGQIDQKIKLNKNCFVIPAKSKYDKRFLYLLSKSKVGYTGFVIRFVTCGNIRLLPQYICRYILGFICNMLDYLTN